MDVALEKLTELEDTVGVLNLTEMETELLCSRLSLLIDKLQHRKNFPISLDWSNWPNNVAYPDLPVTTEIVKPAPVVPRKRKATPRKRAVETTLPVVEVKDEPNNAAAEDTADGPGEGERAASQPEPSTDLTPKVKKEPKRIAVICKLCELAEVGGRRGLREKAWKVTTGSVFKLVPKLTIHVKEAHVERVENLNISDQTMDVTQDETLNLTIDETLRSTRGEAPIEKTSEQKTVADSSEEDGGKADETMGTKPRQLGLSCPLCEKKFTNNQNNVRHMYCRLAFHIHKEHSEPMPQDITVFACSLCEFKTLKSHGLQMHMESSHSMGDKLANKTICTLCAKPIHKANIQIHMLVSHNSADVSEAVKKRLAAVPCPECGRKFRGSSGLERHRKTIHEQAKMHMCDICSARFFAERDLNFHMFSMHDKINRNNVPVHTCPHCDYETLCRRSLTIHMTTHSEVRPYKCEHCDKAFKTASSRLQHTRLSHEKSEVYKCELCDFSSHAKMKVVRHKVIHNKVKRYRCTIPGCDYATHFQENLRKHLRKKTHDLTAEVAMLP